MKIKATNKDLLKMVDDIIYGSIPTEDPKCRTREIVNKRLRSCRINIAFAEHDPLIDMYCDVVDLDAERIRKKIIKSNIKLAKKIKNPLH